MANGAKKSYIVDEKVVISFLKGDSNASYLISLFKEAEAGKIAIYIPINYFGAVFSWAQKSGYRLIKVYDIVKSLPLIVYNFEEDFIDKAVDFNELHQEFSMDEAVLLTLAKEKAATIVTGNKNLKFDDPSITISWV